MKECELINLGGHTFELLALRLLTCISCWYAIYTFLLALQPC